MSWHVVWPETVSGWCFWASFAALVAVIGASLAAPLVSGAGGEGAVDVLWKVVQFGFAGLVISFLLGIVCSRVEDIRRKNREG